MASLRVSASHQKTREGMTKTDATWERRSSRPGASLLGQEIARKVGSIDRGWRGKENGGDGAVYGTSSGFKGREKQF